jgi:cystathionine gamma-lyase
MLYYLLSNANAIALFLESHPGVTKVVYPGLKSHPQHDIAKAQQHGFGAMITFYCIGGRSQSGIVLEKVSSCFVNNICDSMLVRYV